MKKFILVSVLSVSLLSSCATNNSGGPDMERGLIGMFKGMGHLILSPLQIVAGLAEGVASLPYYAGTSLQAINEGMAKAQAKITLDDTYDAAYGKRVSEVGSDGDTGQQFRRMKHATKYFQKILKQHGVPDHQYYLLTSIDTANDKGVTLFAVVYRPKKSITVVDKYDGSTVREFSSDDRLFYEPFKTDAKGRSLDVVIDWAGVPQKFYTSQKQQAVLLTLAANAAVKGNKRSDYWEAEKKWIAGGYADIMKKQNSKVRNNMKI